MRNPFCYTQGQIDYFFTTPGGRKLGIQGKEAQRLAYYLLRNPQLDISGDYALPLSRIMADTGLERDVLSDLFSHLKDVHFCSFDWESEHVSIPVIQAVFERLFTQQTPVYLTEEGEGL
jgi:hypothetical protein